MVNILSSALSGAFMVTDPTRAAKGGMIGHFMMAIDPGLFRDADDFPRRRRFVLRHAARDQARRSGKARRGRGDPERRIAALRRESGIPVGAGLLAKVRDGRAPLERGVDTGSLELLLPSPF